MKNIIGYALGIIGILVSVFALIFGAFFMGDGDEMGFMLVFMYAVLPLTALITAAVMSGVNIRGAIILSAINVIIITVTPFAIFHTFEWISALFGLVPSVSGYLLGMIFRKRTE